MKLLLNQRAGLGNQLFQYAAALYFAKKYNAPLEIIRQPSHKDFSFGSPRRFMLSNFCITTPVRDRTYLDRVLRSISPSVRVLSAPLRRLLGVYSHDPEREIVGDFYSSLPIAPGTRRFYLNGYFQAYQYPQALEDRLRREFTFREPPTGKNLDTFNQIRNTHCPVSLHVRLGDYAKEWQGKNILPSSYYNDAVAAMLQLHPDVTFFVFSDDIESARSKLPPLERVVFVNHNDEAAGHEDLRLMSSCRHHILANSSFSWWGAWLNPDPDKVVFVPQPWHIFASHTDTIPPTWRSISTTYPAS